VETLTKVSIALSA